MAKLTVLHINNLKKTGRLSDGNGLFYEFLNSGLKRWIYRYKIQGKQGVFVLGHYPDMSLSKARKALGEAKQLVKKGINPAQKRRDERQDNIKKQLDTRKKARANVAVDIMPILDKMTEIETLLLKVLSEFQKIQKTIRERQNTNL